MSDFFGLDIGSSSIKLAQMKGKSAAHLSMAINPSGKQGFDLIAAEKQKLVAVVKKLIAESGMRSKKVVVSVPEALVYSKVMNFPVVSSAELASAIKWQADQSIPLAPDKVELSWVVIERPKRKTGGEQMKVLVVAIPKRVSNTLVEFLNLVGLEPMRAENETLALARLFSTKERKEAKGAVLIVDMGATATKMVIMKDGQLRLVYNYGVGGIALTRLLAQGFSLNFLKAEEYKRAYGVNKDQLDGRLFKCMEPVLNNVLAELVKVVGGYNQVNPNGQIERLFLTGGGAYLKGIVGLVSERLGVEVVVGDIFSGYKVDQAKMAWGPIYAVAVGLSIEDKA